MPDHLALVSGPVPAVFHAPTAILSPAHGGCCSFLGVVRDHHHGRTVTALHYQCYAAMAEPLLAALVAEARAAHAEDLAAIVVHASGDLVPGQVAVAIHTASAHRAAAFAACRQLIERIKEDLPIWKRESYADGTSLWLKGS